MSAEDGAKLAHAHPMPGWIAVAPIPEPEDPNAPCAVCGKVHPQEERHMQQFGSFVIDASVVNPAVKVVRAVVLEVGDAPEHLVPFAAGATVHFTSDCGTMIGGVLFMLAQKVICWDD
jgi:hypothetical protein